MTDSTANVFHDGEGNLAIKPIRDSAGNWTSGRVETKRTDFAAPVGGKVRIEGRLQLPNVSGAAAAGYWPAFWTLGDAARPVSAANWPGVGEWDIMEASNGRNSVFATLHCGVTPGGPCNENSGLGSGERPCATCQTEFHTYAVEYDRSVSPEQMRWYLDGTNFFTVDSTAVDETTWNNATHHGMFVILNVAIGGAFPNALGGGPTEATQSGVPMLVDYVAVYQSAGTNPSGPSSPPASPPSSPPSSPPASSPPPTPPTGSRRDAFATIEAESFDASSGVQTETSSEGGLDVHGISNGDWLRFDNVDFGTGEVRDFMSRVASGADWGVGGLVEVRIDSLDNSPIGDLSMDSTGGWQNWRSVPTNVLGVTGTHTVYLTFSSRQPKDFVSVNSFKFRK